MSWKKRWNKQKATCTDISVDAGCFFFVYPIVKQEKICYNYIVVAPSKMLDCLLAVLFIWRYDI